MSFSIEFTPPRRFGRPAIAKETVSEEVGYLIPVSSTVDSGRQRMTAASHF
jgi:hypothetical protein